MVPFSPDSLIMKERWMRSGAISDMRPPLIEKKNERIFEENSLKKNIFFFLMGFSDRADLLIIAGFREDIAVTIDRFEVESDEEAFLLFCEERAQEEDIGFNEKTSLILSIPEDNLSEWLIDYVLSVYYHVDHFE